MAIKNIVLNIDPEQKVCSVKIINALKNREVITTKDVLLKDVLGILSQSLNDNVEQELIFNKNVYKVIDSKQERKIQYIFESQKKNLTIMNSSGKILFSGIVPIPRTLVEINFRKNPTSNIFNNANILFHALKEGQDISVDPRYYHFPFLNVFSDDRICWGSTKIDLGKNQDDFEKISKIFDHFFDSYSNLDLEPVVNYNYLREKYSRYQDCNRKVDLYKYLEKCDHFDERLLIINDRNY